MRKLRLAFCAMTLALYPVRTGYAYELDIGNSPVCDIQEHTVRLVGLYDGDMQHQRGKSATQRRAPSSM
jgi:hypothetical protein